MHFIRSVETSGQPVYKPARQFYERNAFIRAAVIRGFYAPTTIWCSITVFYYPFDKEKKKCWKKI